MADSALDKIIQDAASLPSEEQQRLIQLLTARLYHTSQKKSIGQIAVEQGKGPLNFSEILELGSFFPEDESVDDLVTTVRSLRQDKSARKLD